MNKKYLIIVAVIIGCIVLVSAAWLFVISGDVKINVGSIGTYNQAIVHIGDMNLNTTDGADKGAAVMNFVYNGAGNFTVKITETYSDLSNGECVGGQGDCTLNYSLFDGLSGYPIYNGKNISMPSNSNGKFVAVNMSCVAYSCPQTRDINIKLMQVA